MAQLKDTLIQGSARVTDTLYANTLKGNLDLDYVQDATDLKAIEALTGTAGFLKKTAANTWSLDNSTYSKTDTHVNVSLAGAAISHNYILMTSTAPTSTAAAHTALGATSIWVNSADKGKFELVLGNSTATSSSGGQYGQLALYSASTAGTYLKAADGTSWKTATLQAKDGTIALTSDIPTNLNQLTNGPGYITASSNITGTAANVTGTVAVAHGGTGVTSFTNDCVVVATGTTQTLVSRGLKVTGATDANVTVQSNTSGKHLYINSPGGAADITISTNANSGTGLLYLSSGNTLYINKPSSASIIFTSGGADTSHEKGRFNTNGMFQLNSTVTQNTHKLLVNGDSAFNGKLAFIGTPANTITENASIQYINSGLFYRGTVLTGTGTAAAGNGTNGYTGALWKFNLGIATPNDGDKITIRVPVASHDYGTYVSLDNGTTYRAVGINGSTTRITGQYPVNSIVTLVYDASGTITSLFPPVTPATSRASSNTTNIPGAGCWRVVNYYDSGNSNDAAGYIRQMQNAAYRKTTTALYRYKLLLPHKDGIQVIPVNTSNIQNNTSYPFSTAMTTITTEEFDITRPIEYYSTTGTVNAAGNIDGRYHWQMRSDVDLRYSFNTGTTLTAGKDVYLVATLQAGGLTAKLRNPGATGTNAAATATGANAGPITQTLPTSDDGFIYIKLGNAYSTAAIILTPEHPIYWYKDGEVRPFSPNGSSPSGSASKCLTEKGTWASFTNNAGTVTSITLSAGAGIALDATGAITGSGTRTISISGMNTSTGDTTKFLNQKGGWSTVSTSDTKVTQAYSTTNDSYPLLMSATAGITATTSRGDTTSILNNAIYANPSEGSLHATGGIDSGSVYLRGAAYASGDEGGEIELVKAPNGVTPGIIDIIYEGGVDKLRLRPEGAAAVYVDLTNKVLYGAAWNDYAEYRRAAESLKPGNVIIDNDDGTVSLATKRLLPGAQIVSDTFGFVEGETDEAKTPVAVAGRVLVYTYQNRTNYHAGMAVCSAPNGTVDIMTREEIKEYPDCIIGYVSEIPNYETWGSSNVKVDDRIWVRVK